MYFTALADWAKMYRVFFSSSVLHHQPWSLTSIGNLSRGRTHSPWLRWGYTTGISVQLTFSHHLWAFLRLNRVGYLFTTKAIWRIWSGLSYKCYGLIWPLWPPHLNPIKAKVKCCRSYDHVQQVALLRGEWKLSFYRSAISVFYGPSCIQFYSNSTF